VFYLSAEADMKRELERKEQERKKSPKVEFIPGGVQPSIGASMPKIPGIMNMKQLHLMFWQIIITCPTNIYLIILTFVIYSALAGVATLPVPAEGVKKETRPNKKSKWDKVFNQPLKAFILVLNVDLQG